MDGEAIKRSARELAFPRYSGTPGNERACRLVASWFEEAGLDVAVEPFSYDIRPALRALRLALIAAGLLVGSAAFLATAFPIAALVVLVVGALVGAALLAWSPGAERLYAGPGPTRTANVVGRRPASGSRRMTLILLAHYDSKSQNLTFPWRMGATLLAILGVLGLLGLLATHALGFGVESSWPYVTTGIVAACALFVLSTLQSGDESPGGVDNAGSVAILRALAPRLPSRVPDDVELVFLSPGAEEDHMVGVMRWLDAHRDELSAAPVYALNIDGAGSPGRAVLIERYGFGRPFSRRLSDASRAAARQLGVGMRGIWMPPAIGIDAIPFAHRGYDCVTFSSGALGRATIAVHSANDVAEHLDPATLARVAGWIEAVALRVAG